MDLSAAFARALRSRTPKKYKNTSNTELQKQLEEIKLYKDASKYKPLTLIFANSKTTFTRKISAFLQIRAI